MRSSVPEKAFTLFEVLVLVLIILILVAVLWPASPGGGPSYYIRCLNNQKQITLAAILYAGDSEGRFPDVVPQSGNDGPIPLAFLTNYSVDQAEWFMCPLVVHQRDKRLSPVPDVAFFASNGNDYAYFDGLSTDSGSYTNPILADRFAWTNRTVVSPDFLNHPRGEINVSFVDGHVEMVKREVIVGTNYTPAWSAAQDPIRRP